MNGKKFFKEYTLKQKAKVWKEMDSKERKFIQNLNNAAKYPVTELDFEIVVEEPTFEEVEGEVDTTEEDFEEDSKIVEENPWIEFKKLVLEFEKAVKFGWSEETVEKIEKELEEKFGPDMKDNTKMMIRYGQVKEWFKILKI